METIYLLFYLVNERSTWQEVLKVKLKLDAILNHIQTLQEPDKCTPTPSKETPWTGLVTEGVFSREMPFSYSSLDEWQSIATCSYQRHLLEMEKQILKFLKEKFIPFLEHLERDTKDSTHTLTAMLRVAYELSGAASTPMYILTVDE